MKAIVIDRFRNGRDIVGSSVILRFQAQITIAIKSTDRVDYERHSVREPDLATAGKKVDASQKRCRRSPSRKLHVMTQIDPGAESRSPSTRRAPAGMHKVFIPVAMAVGAFLLLGAGLPWLNAFMPKWVVLRAKIFFLWFLLGAFILAVPAAAIGVAWSCTALSRARRRRDRAGFFAR